MPTPATAQLSGSQADCDRIRSFWNLRRHAPIGAQERIGLLLCCWPAAKLRLESTPHNPGQPKASEASRRDSYVATERLPDHERFDHKQIGGDIQHERE